MDLLRRITRDPAVMGGRPCIRGMRVTVGTVVGLLAAGRTEAEILEAYPYLEPDDIRAALSCCPSHETPDRHEPVARVGSGFCRRKGSRRSTGARSATPGFSALLATTEAIGPSVTQARTQDVLPSAIGADVVRVLRTYSTELEQGAIVTLDIARSRVRVLPIRKP